MTNSALKIQRPGQTETSILFFNYLLKTKIISYNTYIAHMRRYITWLFNNTGTYNKKFDIVYDEKNSELKQGLPPCNIDIDKTQEILSSDFFLTWLETYKNSLYNSHHIDFMHKPVYLDSYGKYTKGFLDFYDIKAHDYNIKFDQFWSQGLHYFNDILENKSILVISCFADLIKIHHQNGRLYKFNKHVTKIKEIIPYTSPYSFLNNGPHQNYHETLNKVIEDINQLSFDIALISYGAYACVLADHIHSKLNKTAIAYGGLLPSRFGILANTDNPHRMSVIPDEYIYEKASMLENGRYWFGEKVWVNNRQKHP